MYRESVRPSSWLLKAGLGLLALLAAFMGFRTTTADHDVPLPIDPDSGEANLLDLINSLPLNDVQQALDNFPVPYVVVATANGAQPTVVNKNAGSPVRIDADRSKTTGKGGDDIQVEVNTELLPTPHIRVNINRITSPSDATDLQVLVAFPFQAFNDEPTLLSPNLFIGYQTNSAGGGAGGIAPLNEEFRIIPGTLAGTSHDFILRMNTTGAANPMTFIAGHFDGNAEDGIENALGMQAYVEPVPASIEIGFDLNQSALTNPGSTSGSLVNFDWTSSQPARVEFTYFEEEGFPIQSGSDYGTTVTFDQMPQSESLGFSYQNAPGGGVYTLSHTASAPIDSVIIEYHRQDGLLVEVEATHVPTDLDLSIDLAGAATLDVNNPIGSLVARVTQEGGFLDTQDFLGYNLGYAEFGVEDAPSLWAGYDATNDKFGVGVTSPGTDIGAVWLVIGDDANLELPPGWADESHIFSLIDNGTHGTAAARVVNLIEASLQLDAAPTGETFAFQLRDDAPMQLYLETTVDSALTAEDIKVQCDVVNMPYGDVDFTIDFPDQFAVNAAPIPGYPETNGAASFVIDEISCAGNVGNLNFELGVGQLPMGSGYKFDANGKLEVTVEPGGVPNSATIGHIRLRLWNEVEPLPSPFSLAPLVSTPLHDARMRVDQIPSFVGTWSDGGTTNVNFKAGMPASNSLFIGGVQVLVSTAVELTTPLEVASPTADDFLTFADLGAGQPKRLGAGVFGLNEFSYNSTDGAGQMSMSYKANAAHKLVIDVDSRFGGDFFPDYDLDLTFTLDAIPATFSMTTEFNPLISYTGSSGISSILLDGYVDNSAGNGTADKTHVVISATSLPSEFALDINPATGATLDMNAAITQVSLELSSDVGILGSPYQLIQGGLNNIPAKWNINWESGGFLVESKDAADNPSPMGSVTGLISTSKDGPTNDAKIAPLTLDGPNLAGVITGGDSGCRVDYSEFLQEIDRRYYDVGASSVKSRLDELYCGSEQLDPGEDHAVALMVGGSLDFASLKFTGFQKIQYAPDANGGHYELKVPTPGLHPFFVGVGLDSNFATLQLENIPDSMVLDIDTAAGLITYDAADDVDPSVGEIDVYYGPLPLANDGSTAVRAILRQTPSFVHIKWDLGFPNGDAWFDASNEFELLFLAQSGSKRVTGGMAMEDLHLHYGIEGPGYTPCDEVAGVDTCYGLLRATAGIDNDADEFASTLAINDSKADLAAFIAVYDLIGGPAALTGSCLGTCPGPVGNEYVPLVTAATKDFRGVILVFEIQFDPLLPTSDFWPIDFEYNPTGPEGQVVVDVWDQGFSVEFAGFEYTNDPDYIDNNPWHIIPITTLTTAGLHTFSDHDFDPFGP